MTNSRSVASVPEKLKSFISFCVYFVSRPNIDLSRKPVEQWDKSDTEQWFHENKISMDAKSAEKPAAKAGAKFIKPVDGVIISEFGSDKNGGRR